MNHPLPSPPPPRPGLHCHSNLNNFFEVERHKKQRERLFNVRTNGGAEFAGPENDGPKKIKEWKMQDLNY